MTRNEAIWQCAVHLYANNQQSRADAIERAQKLATLAESEGCAPWQDAPAQPEPFGPDADARREAAYKESRISAPVPPVRREITEADVQVGAKFTRKDKVGYEVFFIEGDTVKSYLGLDGGIYRTRYVSKMKDFLYVLNDNGYNATVTPPSQA